MHAWKRLDWVGKMLWIILTWNMINFDSFEFYCWMEACKCQEFFLCFWWTHDFGSFCQVSQNRHLLWKKASKLFCTVKIHRAHLLWQQHTLAPSALVQLTCGKSSTALNILCFPIKLLWSEDNFSTGAWMQLPLLWHFTTSMQPQSVITNFLVLMDSWYWKKINNYSVYTRTDIVVDNDLSIDTSLVLF